MIRLLLEKRINFTEESDHYEPLELTKKQFIDILKSKGIVTIGHLTFKVLRVEPNSIIETEYPELYKQLLQEGRKGHYIVGMISTWRGYANIELPIYGNSEKYVTKWFYETQDKAIQQQARELLSPGVRPFIRKK